MAGRERTLFITGATGGLGRGLALALSTRPGRLILHGRDDEKLAALRAELRDARAGIDTVKADLSEQAQVHRLAEELAGLTDHLSVLVNNAGVGPGRGDQRELSPDGAELRLAVNHLAPFALSIRLLPLLRKGAPSRIVNVASGAQQALDFDDLHLEKDYSGLRAYSQSKLALITTGFVLAEHLPAEEVTVNSLHPGSLMPTAMVKEAWGYTRDSLETGIEATLRLIESPEVEGVTGAYFSGTQQTEARPQAYDPEARRKLWSVSEELTRTRL